MHAHCKHVHIRILPRTGGLLARAHTDRVVYAHSDRAVAVAAYYCVRVYYFAFECDRGVSLNVPRPADRPVSHTRFTGNHKLGSILNNKIDDYARAPGLY